MTTADEIEKIQELLTHIWVTGASADPLVHRLTDSLRLLLEDEVGETDEAGAGSALDEAGEGSTLDEALNDGWQHALDCALDLVEDELQKLRDGGDAVNPAVEAPLITLLKALDHRKLWSPDEYVPTEPESGDEGKRRDPTFGPRQNTPRQDTARLNISPRERVLKMIPMGRSELRENVTRVLTEEYGVQPSAAANAITRLLISGGPLKEIRAGKHKVLKRVA